jgi:hypothetical protein
MHPLGTSTVPEHPGQSHLLHLTVSPPAPNESRHTRCCANARGKPSAPLSPAGCSQRQTSQTQASAFCRLGRTSRAAQPKAPGCSTACQTAMAGLASSSLSALTSLECKLPYSVQCCLSLRVAVLCECSYYLSLTINDGCAYVRLFTHSHGTATTRRVDLVIVSWPVHWGMNWWSRYRRIDMTG